MGEPPRGGEQYKALVDVLQIISHTLNLDQLLSDSLRSVLEFIRMDAGAIRLWDEQSQDLKLIAHYGLSDLYIRETGRERKVKGLTSGRVVVTKEPFIVEDSLIDNRLVGRRNLRLKEGIRSFVVLPLLSKEKVMAIMGIYNRSPHKFTDEEIRFITAVGNQLGAAIDNAQLFSELKLRNETLSSFKHIAEQVNRSLDLNQVLDDVLSVMRSLLKVDAAHIRLLDESTGELVLTAHQGYSKEDIEKFVVRRRKGEGTAYRIMISQKPYVVENTIESNKGRDSLTGKLGISSYAGIPLRAKDKTIGILSVDNLTSRAFTPEDIEILALVGNHLGIAIDHARLYHDLAESERNYRELFESNPHPMWVYDAESLRILMVNNAAVSNYGYSREEFLGMTISDIRPPDDVPRLVDTVQSLPAGYHNSGLWRHRKKDGAIIDVEVTSHALNFHGSRARLVFSHDVTDRRRAEEERERLQAQLLQSQKMEAIGRLAGGIAHDFNNMLGVITGRAELMLQGMEDGHPLRNDLEQIMKAGSHSAELTGQLLAFARKQTIAPRVLDLNDTVSGMLLMIRRLIGEEIELFWAPGKGLWPVKVDPAQINQMLANLCVNARDAIGGVGNITIETQNVTLDKAYCADHSGFAPGSYVMMAVSDDGRGMSRDVLEHVFEPFYTTKGLGEGTGLGLATVYGIVKQNDGFINVYSEPMRGTTFKVYLPRCPERVAAAPSEGVREDATREKTKGTETILLVEDEEMLLELGMTMLEGLGYRVFTAKSPSEALKIAETHAGEIDLLMTDVVLPEMSGRDLAERIKAMKKGIGCLYMSGYTANVIAHRGILDAGVQFLQKPFSLKNLASKVREALDNK